MAVIGPFKKEHQMNRLLKGIQPQLNKYAQIVHSILEVDVEIVDIDFIRISGTGIYQKMLDVDTRDEGHLYASVFEHKADRIVLDILNHPICGKCDKKGTCANKLIIAVPIIYGGEAVGTIGIISTEDDKKKYIQARLRQYLEFVHHIADLITVKLRESQARQIEQQKQEMWMGIVDVIEDGVAILGKKGRLYYANSIGRDLLNLPADAEDAVVTLHRAQEGPSNYDRLFLNIGDNQITIMGKMIAIHDQVSDYDKLIMIKRLIPPDEDSGEDNTKTSHKLIGDSEPMIRIHQIVRRVANSPSTVLINGESGTGKEFVAHEIHQAGNRRDKPFVAVNCGAIPEPLLESELFGYVKGAFTGANLAGKVGKFELANTGILFLDEIGDMPLLLQVKILRVLQEKKLYRVGSNQIIDLDLKIIAASNKNLEDLCRQGLFRVDLYYRLNVIQIEMPPLRERREDIPRLFRHFVDKYSQEFGFKRVKVSPEAEECLTKYDWVGNVRELENAVEYAMNFVTDGQAITPDLLPVRICRTSAQPDMESAKPLGPDFLDESSIKPLEEMNKNYLLSLLDRFGSSTESKKRIASQLGISPATLYRMLK